EGCPAGPDEGAPPGPPLVIDPQRHPSRLKPERMPRPTVPGRELDPARGHGPSLPPGLADEAQDGLQARDRSLDEILVADSQIAPGSSKENLGQRVPVHPFQGGQGGAARLARPGAGAMVALRPLDPRVDGAGGMADEMDDEQVHRGDAARDVGEQRGFRRVDDHATARETPDGPIQLLDDGPELAPAAGQGAASPPPAQVHAATGFPVAPQRPPSGSDDPGPPPPRPP